MSGGNIYKGGNVCNELLISEVAKRHSLWDQKHVNYHNRTVMTKHWESIEAVMQTPVDKLKKRWKNLRDQFRSDCKKIPMEILADPITLDAEYMHYTNWRHFKSMMFLKNQLKKIVVNKPLMDNSKNNTFVEEITIIDDSDSEQWDEQPNGDSGYDGGGCGDTVAGHHERYDYGEEEATHVAEADIEHPMKRRIIDNSTNETTSSRQTSVGIVAQQNLERDGDQAFFDSLLPYMKNMDMRSKMRCRIDIQNIVYNYLFLSSDGSTSNPYVANMAETSLNQRSNVESSESRRESMASNAVHSTQFSQHEIKNSPKSRLYSD